GNAVRKVLSCSGSTVRLSCGSFADYALSDNGRLYVVGAGKAAAAMASAAEEILGDLIRGGVISVKYGHTQKLSLIRQIESAHPVPDENGVSAAREIKELLSRASEDDLIISLISGGASALLCLPAEGISLADKQAATGLLLKCGADISELNCVRKHLSSVKGGLLARAAYPARTICICISDVIGDDLSVIGSGPFSPDSSTYGDALRILDAYALRDLVPSSVLSHLEKGFSGEIEETPKKGDKFFSAVSHCIPVSNERALRAAAFEAEKCGYDVRLISEPVSGDTSAAAKMHARLIRTLHSERSGLTRPIAVISGGETTVKVKGSGKGGRNTEFVLRCAMECADLSGVYIFSAGTDGTDGPTDAAGAWVLTDMMRSSAGLLPRAERYAENNDSYAFFSDMGTLIRTGPTGTNVLDVRIIVITPLMRHNREEKEGCS
ncbi:MAG: glycerate kinase type-2 family protein, partial [Spirochaetota bacterium]